MRSAIAVAALALVSVTLPACGGGGDSSAKSNKAKFMEAALKHAQCMRANGVDFPDPNEISQEEGAQIERQELAQARCMRAEGFDVSDPVVDSRGRVQMKAPAGGVKPDGPRWMRATEKCRAAVGGGPVPTKRDE